MKLPKHFERMIEHLRKLPGVGEKSAMRLALTLSRWSEVNLNDFALSIRELSQINYCKKCGLFAEGDCCSICLDERRGEAKTVCVVETITDALAIERGGDFKGRFHILGGVLNPLLGIGPGELNLAALISRVNDKEITSLILAINPSVEGDATCAYINQILDNRVSVERIGFGIPMGGSLEYLDPMTISKALENRKRM